MVKVPKYINFCLVCQFIDYISTGDKLKPGIRENLELVREACNMALRKEDGKL